MKVNVIFHSMHSHTYELAKAVAEGAGKVPGVEVAIYRVPETLPGEVLEKMGATETVKKFAHLPEATMENLAEADAVIFGTPTRFGNMTGQMRSFLDRASKLWTQNALVGKVGSVFVTSATQHGGQESTILSFHTTLLHLGMIVVGLPYSETRQMTMDEISGGSPYGVSSISGGDGSRMPSENELAMARFQGRHVAEITIKLGSKKPVTTAT
jgi:NAD(P)H dehydrogenase (quinone)